MNHRIACIAYLVRDYDEALDFFLKILRFQLIEDSSLGGGKRWVRVAPSGQPTFNLLLARASSDQQQAIVGQQGGGRVWLFLETNQFYNDYEHLKTHGVHFLEEVRHETYGTVVVFEDLYGNRWDLIQPNQE